MCVLYQFLSVEPTMYHVHVYMQGEQRGHVKELETDCRQKEARLDTATEQLAAAEEKIQVRGCSNLLQSYWLSVCTAKPVVAVDQKSF